VDGARHFDSLKFKKLYMFKRESRFSGLFFIFLDLSESLDMMALGAPDHDED
jgi:hypothetical protein